MDRFQWGTREIWPDGYVRDEQRHSEDDARARMDYVNERKRRQDKGMSTAAEWRLIRRPVGDWEEVTD